MQYIIYHNAFPCLDLCTDEAIVILIALKVENNKIFYLQNNYNGKSTTDIHYITIIIIT